MRIYRLDFLKLVFELAKEENARYVVFDEENLDILGTAKTIKEVKKIARKYLNEDCEEACIMYYDDKEQSIFFLKSC
ncbi:MAG: hypothetical protein K2N64_01060 [Anaeroplasmataceae bacterium]|nr:hypothetical protein [Anaeroplasmataceae bacterium]